MVAISYVMRAGARARSAAQMCPITETCDVPRVTLGIKAVKGESRSDPIKTGEARSGTRKVNSISG